jgi:hypothetical protein
LRTIHLVALCALAFVLTWLALQEDSRELPTEGCPPPDRHADAPANPSLAHDDRPDASEATPPPPSEAADPPVVLVGVVVDETGTPVEGATVIATIAGVETGRARSAADGTFDVALVPAAQAAAARSWPEIRPRSKCAGSGRAASACP